MDSPVMRCDAKWVDEGSTAGEKRRAEKAAEAAEAARRRAEKKALAAKEEEAAASISAKSKGLTNAEKITRAQILRQQEELMEQRRLEAERAKMEAKNLAPQIEPQENLNRQASDELAKDIEQFGIGNVIHASGIDTTLQSLSGGALSSSSSTSTAGAIDQHPEKRMKSAFAEYEDRMMPIVRSENPRLKLSQYKEMIFKSWQKSPDNPFNKRKMQEASLLESTDAWKYGNFRE